MGRERTAEDARLARQTVADQSTANDSGAVKTQRRRVPLLAKSILLFVAVAMLPALGVSWWLTGLYRNAIETTERQLQTAVLAELSSLSLRAVDDVQADAEAIASALSTAAESSNDFRDVALMLRSILSTRRAIRAARFEVPEAKVSTVLRRAELGIKEPPASTAELRRVADERKVAFAVLNANEAVLVVPVPHVAPTAKSGYVTVAIDTAAIGNALQTVAETRFDDRSVNLLIADADRRVVAAFGPSNLTAGSAVEALSIWSVLPAGTPWSRRVSIVSEHWASGGLQVGGIETVPHLGWAVAVWRPKAAAYRSLAALTPRFAVAAFTSLLLALMVGLLAARAISGPVIALAEQAKLIGQRRWENLTQLPLRNDEIGELASTMAHMAIELVQSEDRVLRESQLRADLCRFMSPELSAAIIRGEHQLDLGGKRAEITVLFADVVAFTRLAEQLAPEEVVGLLNELFGLLSEIVFRHGGTVDKFIGDCIMAVFGVPVADPQHAVRGLRAAEEMLRFLEAGNEEWRERYGVDLKLAIGVNSGTVIVGNVGSKKRMEYTVIGDVVNVAARLESIARPNQILLTSATLERAGADFEVNSCGEQLLLGRKQSTKLYELVTD